MNFGGALRTCFCSFYRRKVVLAVQSGTCRSSRTFGTLRTILQRVRQSGEPYVVEAGSAGTNVIKDVLLFSYANARFFKYMTLFAAVQFSFWAQLSYFALVNYRRKRAGISKPKPKPPVKPADQRWYSKFALTQDQLGGGSYPLVIGTLYLVAGAFITTLMFMFAYRSVHQLALLKGGKSVSITTFAPFGFFRTFIVPLENLSTEVGRQGGSGFLPLKVRNRPLNYLLDKSGKFHNTMLFDLTAGMHRPRRK